MDGFEAQERYASLLRSIEALVTERKRQAGIATDLERRGHGNAAIRARQMLASLDGSLAAFQERKAEYEAGPERDHLEAPLAQDEA
ncbi:hypothetical protein OSH08_14170 [Kaistia geumhonensis]|nr:hypothetical protein [Kaistia geumhonensis]MCX5480157.1 hypothetical protein [Kaistia geumhonensis]